MRMKVTNPVVIAGVLAAAAWAAGAAGCLVDSNCLNDADCHGFEQCNLATGDCFLECSPEELDICPNERPLCLEDEYRCVECMAGVEMTCQGDTAYCLLEEYRCVECLEDEQCDEGEECVANTCYGAAPTFALVDRNPASPTYEETVDLADLQGELVLVFFAGLS